METPCQCVLTHPSRKISYIRYPLKWVVGCGLCRNGRVKYALAWSSIYWFHQKFCTIDMLAVQANSSLEMGMVIQVVIRPRRRHIKWAT